MGYCDRAKYSWYKQKSATAERQWILWFKYQHTHWCFYLKDTTKKGIHIKSHHSPSYLAHFCTVNCIIQVITMPPTCNLRMLGSHDSATLGCNGSNILLNASNWVIERNWSNRVTYYGSPIDLYRFTCSTECGRRKRFCTLCLSLWFFHNLGVPVSIQQEAKLMTRETSGQMSYLINNASKTLSMTLRS